MEITQVPKVQIIAQKCKKYKNPVKWVLRFKKPNSIILKNPVNQPGLVNRVKTLIPKIVQV